MKYFIKETEKRVSTGLTTSKTEPIFVYYIDIKNSVIAIKLVNPKHISIDLYIDNLKYREQVYKSPSVDKNTFKDHIKTNIKNKFKINIINIIMIVLRIISILK
jgi:hypothetical protein